MKKNCKKTNETDFSIEKGRKKKGNKLNANCKLYDDLFNSWIDKKDTIK